MNTNTFESMMLHCLAEQDKQITAQEITIANLSKEIEDILKALTSPEIG